ncbi:hypothetical protein HJG54_30930 [Leptolyngbya sp. NK1-12]|uniref:Phytanoyl-CoA dioxygenase n=1 Tax=Leptolyngbya sp. NK1-12 TaxID=2547451 RepID=A0AA96WMA6_9CYAN|nr:hypothetical protein [Leptolyngbya sp. NK1-12]WNZ27305.1 hypothetical protein HJG54_30930 [Leptolyngbya sp. NK1-12]
MKSETPLQKYFRLIEQSITDYRWFLYYLQRQKLEPRDRSKVSSVISRLMPSGNFEQIAKQYERDIHRFKTDGLCFLEDWVSENQALQIKQHLMSRPCFDPDRLEKVGFFNPEAAHKSCLHAHYRIGDILDCPQILKLANHPRALGIVSYLFGCKPTISLIQAWWLRYGFDEYENQNNLYLKYPESYHRDIDDWTEIRLFIYLSDVDETSGPHSYIKNTYNRSTPDRYNKFSTTPQQLEISGFPVSENMINIVGKPGTAWLMNPFGFHRAKIPTQRHRLILCITYTFFPQPFAPAKPVINCSTESEFDPYINRVYVKREKSIRKGKWYVDWSKPESFEISYAQPKKSLRRRYYQP